jgi:hypothetical protein
MNITELELEFTAEDKRLGKDMSGFVFKQKAMTEWGYIYEAVAEDTVSYEIFERMIYPKYDFVNKCDLANEFKVSYPGHEAFGKWAWTTRDYTRATQILKEIEEKVKYRIANGLATPSEDQPLPIDLDVEEASSQVAPE